MTTVEKDHAFRLFCQGKSNKQIYKDTCAEIGIRRNSALSVLLSTEADCFDMQTLDVGSNMLGADGVRSLFKVVAANKHLAVLGLSGQGLDDQVFLELVEIIRGHPGLTSVDVSHNPFITNASSAVLFSALRDNTMLCEFSVTGCSIGMAYQRRIFDLANANDQLERKFFEGNYLNLKKLYMQLDNGNPDCITMPDLINNVEIPKVMMRLTKQFQQLVDAGKRSMNENIPINTFLDFVYPHYKSVAEVLSRVKEDDLKMKTVIDNQLMLSTGMERRRRTCAGLHLIRIAHLELTEELVERILDVAVADEPVVSSEDQQVILQDAVMPLLFGNLKKAVAVVVPAPEFTVDERRKQFRLAPELVHQIVSLFHTRDDMPIGELLEQKFETVHQALTLKLLEPILQSQGLPVKDMPMSMQEVVCLFEEYYDKIVYHKKS